MAAGGLRKGSLPHAVGEQPAEVDVGERELRLVREASRLGEQVAVLEHHRVAVPCEVGGGLAQTRRAVEVGRNAACRLVAAELLAKAVLADHDVRRREIGDYRRAGEGGE